MKLFQYCVIASALTLSSVSAADDRNLVEHTSFPTSVAGFKFNSSKSEFVRACKKMGSTAKVDNIKKDFAFCDKTKQFPVEMSVLGNYCDGKLCQATLMTNGSDGFFKLLPMFREKYGAPSVVEQNDFNTSSDGKYCSSKDDGKSFSVKWFFVDFSKPDFKSGLFGAVQLNVSCKSGIVFTYAMYQNRASMNKAQKELDDINSNF